MSKRHVKLYGAGGAGGGAGAKKVADEAARLALTPADGDLVIQLDTDELYEYDETTTSWLLIGSPEVITTIQDSSSIDLSKPDAHTIAAALKLSVDGADADNRLVDLEIRTDGLRAQIQDAAIFGIFSADAPLQFDAGTGHFSITPADASNAGSMSAAAYTALVDVVQGLSDHLGDTSDAHDASAISVSAIANLAAADVQAALAEMQGDLDTLLAVTHVAMSLAAFGSSPNANGLSVSGTDNQTLNMQPADQTNPGGVSIAAQVFGGEKRFPSGAKVGSSAALASNVIFEVLSTSKGSIPMPLMTTAQKAAVSTPTEGMMAYDTDIGMPVVYNGTNWEPISGYAIPGSTTVADSGTLTLGKYTKQVQRVGGNGGPASISVVHTALKEGSVVVLVGTDDTNPITLSSNGTTFLLNGPCVLGLDDQIEFVKVGTVLRELSRSE